MSRHKLHTVQPEGGNNDDGPTGYYLEEGIATTSPQPHLAGSNTSIPINPMTSTPTINGGFNNGTNSNGNSINKRGGSKKGGKGKKCKSKGNGNHSKEEQHSDENHTSARGHRRNVINDTKHIHDNDDDESSLQKKLQSSKLSTSLSSASPRWKIQDWMRYLILHTLALFITVPLLLSSGGILGCGGRAKFNHLVNIVLLKQRQQQQLDSSTSGNAGFSMTELMEHMSTTSRNINNAQHFRNNNRWIKRKYDDTNDLHNISISNDTDLHESMCHVTAIAIGQFSFHLPYAQWLVLRKTSSLATLFSSSTSVKMMDNDKRSTQLLDNDSSNSKMETLSVHKLDNKISVSSSLVDGRRHHPILRIIAIFLNPIRIILQKASIYFHHRKQTRMKNREEKENSKTSNNGIVGGITMDVEWKKWKYAMTDDYELTPNEIQLVKELAGRVIANSHAQCPGDEVNNNNNKTISCNETEMSIPSQSGGSNIPNRPFHERVDLVSWGGIHNNDDTRWWAQKSNTDPSTMISAHVDGGRLLAAYLKIMKWDSIYPKFPFRLCPKGCNPEVALLHTLEWREKYKPWCVSNEMIHFNTAGFIYTRGHSNPGIIQRRYMTEIAQSNAGHSMVWYRPSLASPSVNTELYMRTIIHTLDLAVSDSLLRNSGTIGRFNLVMDFSGMSSKNSPTIANVKRLFSVLQDHFPDRLGVLLVTNASTLTQMLMKMMLPFVTEDVRAKIHIIPDRDEERRDMLLQLMTEDQIPYYLGGKDEYNYDAIQYYHGKCVLLEESITEYVSTMPFHA